MKALITGGSASGKSQCAENLCQALGGNLVYLATMSPVGREADARIRKHRAQRAGKGFLTIECSEGLGRAIADRRTRGATALLEDLGNTVANRLFDGTTSDPASIEHEIACALDQLASLCAHLVVVGNEVGGDGIDYGNGTEAYQRLLGRISQRWAEQCDLAAECVAGVPHVLKAGGEPGHDLLA
jgi:adenosylcobinamide kinase/adenosylcobinamide-phosphate guanylyltransferase